MWKRIQPYFSISCIVLLSTFVLWMPFIFKWPYLGYTSVKSLSLLNLYNHWDGILYVIVAKTFYQVTHPLMVYSPLGIGADYYAAHFPLYPLLIKLGSFAVGYLKAMLLWPVVFAALYGMLFYRFVTEFKLTKHALLLTAVALFFTPRFFIVRSVPAPETIFMFLVLASFYFFLKQKYMFAGLMGAFAVLTKSPGIHLFFAYSLFFAEHFIHTKKIEFRWTWILLIPLALLGLFGFYAIQYGDFFAYFHSGDNIHLLFPPFQVFNSSAPWVATGWLEDIYFVYIFYLFVLMRLYHEVKLRPIFYFCCIFFISVISVQHRDISRYSLPMLPFGLMVYEKFFTSKKMALALILLLPALYVYAWNFMSINQAPVTEWWMFQ